MQNFDVEPGQQKLVGVTKALKNREWDGCSAIFGKLAGTVVKEGNEASRHLVAGL